MSRIPAVLAASGLTGYQVEIIPTTTADLRWNDLVIVEGGEATRKVSAPRPTGKGDLRVSYLDDLQMETFAAPNAPWMVVRVNGHLCPCCGGLAIRDFNKVPASFWKADRQATECEQCGVKLVRNGAYGASEIDSAWKRQ